jgi:hypothetical protein
MSPIGPTEIRTIDPLVMAQRCNRLSYLPSQPYTQYTGSGHWDWSRSANRSLSSKALSPSQGIGKGLTHVGYQRMSDSIAL